LIRLRKPKRRRWGFVTELSLIQTCIRRRAKIGRSVLSKDKDSDKKSENSGSISIRSQILLMVIAQMQTAQTLTVEVRNK